MPEMFPDDFRKCGLFLRHKEHLINPFHVAAQGIPVFRTIQHPGQTVLTMPGCYHWGFNTGYSLNEAVNYVIPQWEGFGICARVCKCTGG
jgi:jumonji domain-containing protein 2